MQVEYVFPRNSEEADVLVETDDKTGTVKVTVIPYFYTPEATPTTAYVRTATDEGSIVYRETQQLAGRTGKIRRISQSRRVQPRCEVEQTKEEK